MEREYNLQNRDLVASVYEKYYTDFKQYLVSYTHDMMAAEDMLQDLFVKVMGIDMISDDTAKNLLFVMAKRMIIDDSRHKAFVRESEKQMRLSMSSSMDNNMERRVEAADILHLEKVHVESMAPKRASIYKMYRHDGFSPCEIAKLLHLSKRTVDTQIYLATKDVKSYLRQLR